MKDKYVLDSSIWIDIERGKSSTIALTQPLIDKNQVCLVDLIVAELLRGTKSLKDYQLLKKAFAAFSQLTTSWEKVAQLAFEVGRKGYTPPLTDLYIAQCVWENKKILITRDKDFAHIANCRAFAVEIL